MMLSTKATGSEFTICASGKVSYERRRGKYGAAMAGGSRPTPAGGRPKMPSGLQSFARGLTNPVASDLLRKDGGGYSVWNWKMFEVFSGQRPIPAGLNPRGFR
jgi:hypothetical protein